MRLLRNGGAIFVEMAYDQSMSVPDIFSSLGYTEIETVKDYGGIVRVMKALRQ